MLTDGLDAGIIIVTAQAKAGTRASQAHSYELRQRAPNVQPDCAIPSSNLYHRPTELDRNLPQRLGISILASEMNGDVFFLFTVLSIEEPMWQIPSHCGTS
jgi:hypothetical protein